MSFYPNYPDYPNRVGISQEGPSNVPTDEAMTFTGDLITDAVREADVEGDGLTPPAGVGIWPAATNIVTQSIPGATAGTGVTLAGAVEATLTKVADAAAPFQNSSTDVWLLDNSAGGTDATVDFAGNATAAAHTGSAWARAIVGSPTVSIEGGGTPTVIAVSAAYARYSQSRTASAGDNLRITAPAGAVVRFTAGQLETGSIATPFIATDGGTASRVAGRVQQPVAGLFTATQGAVFARVNPGMTHTTGDFGDARRVMDWRNAGVTEFIILEFQGATGATAQVRYNSTASGGSNLTLTAANPMTAGTPKSVAYFWRQSPTNQMGISVNGASFTTGQQSTVVAATLNAVANADVGGAPAGSTIRSNVLWYATFAGTLTDADSAALNAFGDTPPTWDQLYGILPSAAGLTSLWPAVDTAYEQVA